MGTFSNTRCIKNVNTICKKDRIDNTNNIPDIRRLHNGKLPISHTEIESNILITDTQFTKMPSMLPTAIQASIQNLDLRSIYRELRGSGASLCLSLTESRVGVPFTHQVGTIQQNGSTPSYLATWYYPEINGALRLHLSDLRTILRTVTERLAE